MTMLELFCRDALDHEVFCSDGYGNIAYQFIAKDGRRIHDADLLGLCQDAGISVTFNQFQLLVPA